MSKSAEDLLEELTEENIHEELRRKIQRTATIMLKQEYENILDEAEGRVKKEVDKRVKNYTKVTGKTIELDYSTIYTRYEADELAVHYTEECEIYPDNARHKKDDDGFFRHAKKTQDIKAEASRFYEDSKKPTLDKFWVD